MQFERAHPENFPKQSAQFGDSPSFFIMHFEVHSALPQQLGPHLFKAFFTSLVLLFQITLSCLLHCPPPVAEEYKYVNRTFIQSYSDI